MNNAFKMSHSLLSQMSDSFSIERNGSEIASSKGFFCGKDYPSTIQLLENVDVQDGDWLIHSLTNRRYYAQHTEPITRSGEILSWMVKYRSETEYKNDQSFQSQANINIQSVNGPAIIGNQQNAALHIGRDLDNIRSLISTFSGNDKKSAEELAEELEKIESSNHPILIEGSLSKFSDLLKKHSDLLIAVGGWAVQLLIGK